MKQLIALMILTAGLTFADPPEALVMNYSSEFLARLWSMIPGVPLHAPGFVNVLITPRGGPEDSYRVTVIPPSGKAQQVTVARAQQGVTLAPFNIDEEGRMVVVVEAIAPPVSRIEILSN